MIHFNLIKINKTWFCIVLPPCFLEIQDYSKYGSTINNYRINTKKNGPNKTGKYIIKLFKILKNEVNENIYVIFLSNYLNVLSLFNNLIN